ncbi:MAG: 23S rRNA (adenine(2503)-C(2))-methyltransferase RlmN [Bacteroidetes bacterium]|jgi:23S rRNA (adenine2503-C2)-methyltransferase|nr:23S rRNA (adenine(2503)-C(2))-methyltransferase RlmN [Bacteroidota bacterium]
MTARFEAIGSDGSKTRLNLLGKTDEELQKFFADIGEAPYRGKQLFNWIYQKQVEGFEPITGFTKSLRAKLSDIAEIKYPEVAGSEESKFDGTLKLLLQLEDGNKIETVLIPKEKSPDEGGSIRETVCVSTQVGCPLDCKFCATGAMKLSRNLTTGEIVSQVLIAQRHARKRITNVVFMGMGEPLLNYDAVVKAIGILTDDRSINIRAKGITVSTAGISDKLPLLARESVKFRLAISLHSLDEEVRSLLMPINRKYKLERLLPAVKEFAKLRHDRITFEYILFDRLNDTDADIARLVRLSGEIPLKINLLRYHPLDHLSRLGLQIDPAALKLKPSDRIDKFADGLREKGITVFVRSNSGEDIDGACGQLAAKNVRKHKNSEVTA